MSHKLAEPDGDLHADIRGRDGSDTPFLDHIPFTDDMLFDLWVREIARIGFKVNVLNLVLVPAEVSYQPLTHCHFIIGELTKWYGAYLGSSTIIILSQRQID